MNLSTNASSKSTILDHIDNFSVSGDVFSKPVNEYWALICLQKGLSFLNHQITFTPKQNS